MELKPNEKLDILELMKDLDKYQPKRRGWTWRKKEKDLEMGPFTYQDCAKPLEQSVPLPSAKYFGDIDPSRTASSPQKSPPGVLKTTSAACAWPPGMAPTT
jgi:hypothetical protein